MYKRYLVCLVLLLLVQTQGVWSQQIIGAEEPDGSAALEIYSVNRGFLIPRVSLVGIDETDPIVGVPAVSLLVYNTTMNEELRPGYYYWTGNYWKALNEEIVGSELPRVGKEGNLFFHTDSSELYVHDGFRWVLAGTDDQTLEEVLAQGSSAEGRQITNLAAPQDSADAATKYYVDDQVAAAIVEITEGDVNPNDNDIEGKKGDSYYNTATQEYYIHNGDTWVLAGTDNQQLGLSGDTLTLERGGGVALTSLGTDDQQLNLIGTKLSLEDGGEVELSVFSDDLGSHSATQNIRLNGKSISDDGDEEGISLTDRGALNLKTTAKEIASFENEKDAMLTIKTKDDRDHTSARDLGYYMKADDVNKWSLRSRRKAGADKYDFFIENHEDAEGSRKVLFFGGDSSKVGIHTTDPQTTLDIRGTIRILDGTQGEDKVLTSDADGKGVWKKIGVNNIEANGNATNSVLATDANGDLEWASLDSVGNQTLEEVLAQGSSAGGSRISDLAVPQDSADAATKNYVDDKVADATELDLDSGNILVGGANNKASSVAMSGDVAISSVGVTTIQDNSVTVAKINSQGNADKVLVTGSGGVPSWRKITASKMANNAVTTPKIANYAVTTPKMANYAVTTVKMDSGAVTTEKMASRAVTTPKIEDDAVTTPKIEDDAVTPEKIGGTNGSSDAYKVLATDANGDPTWTSSDSIDNQTLEEVLSQGSSAGGSRISDLAAPQDSSDAATKNYVDDQVAGAAQELSVVADSLTISNGNSIPISSLGTDDQQLYYDSLTKILILEDGGDSIDLSGLDQTLAEILSQGSSAGGSRISDLAAPQDSADAATKNYVDDKVADATELDLDSGNILVGNVNDKASAVAMSGDVVIDSDGETTIENGSVTTPKMANYAVTAVKMASGAVTTPKMASGAVTTPKMANYAVTTEKMASGAVTTPKIEDNAVTPEKIGGTNGSSDADKVLATDANGDPTWTSSDGIDNQTLEEVLAQGSSAEGFQIRNLGEPTVDSDAATKNYVDDQVAGATQELSVVADSLTISNGNSIPISSLGTDDQQLYYDSLTKILTLEDGGDSIDLSGLEQTLAEILSQGSSAGDNRITNLAAPQDSADAATKDYVDDKVADATELDLDSGNILVGNVNDKASAVAMSGDVVIDSDGETTIENGSVTTPKMANYAVTAVKMANYAVTAVKMASGAVTTPKMASGAVTTPKMANYAVTTEKMASGAVTTPKIEDNAVTPEKIGGTNGSSDADKVLATDANGDPTWTSSDGIDNQTLEEVLAQGSSAEGFQIRNLGEPTVDSDAATKNYVDDQVAGAAQELSVVANSLTISNGNSIPISSLGTDDQQLYYDSLTKILTLEDGGDSIDLSGLEQTLAEILSQGSSAGDNRITNLAAPQDSADAATKDYVDDKVADATELDLDSGNILVGNVNDKASAVAMSGDVVIDSDGETTIENGSVTTPKMANYAVTAVKMASGAVTTPKMASGAVTTPKMASRAVTTPKMANYAVTTEKMASGAVTTPKIEDDAVTPEKIGGTNGSSDAYKVLATDANGDPTWTSSDSIDNQTLEEVLSQGSSAGGSRISDLAAPQDSSDAATKNYVDDQVAAAGDNLGNHRATQNILLQGNWISNNNSRDEKGIKLKDSGSLQLKTTSADVATFERAGIMNFRLISTGDTDHTRNRYLGHFMNVDGNDKWSMTIARPPQESKFNFQIHNYEATTYELRNAFYIGGDSSKVGIHTTNPQATLDIKGNIRIEDGTQGAGKVLTSDAIGKARWTSPDSVRVSLDSGYILVGDVNNKASAVEMSGDVEIDSDGEATIQDNSVTVAKINSQGNADKVLGTGSGGVPFWGKITVSKMANNAVSTAKIQDDAVTLAKIGTGGLLNANKVLATGNGGNPRWASFDELGDNLGNHRATQNILLQGNWISNNNSRDEKGIKLKDSGSLQLKTTSADVATFERAGIMNFRLISTGDTDHTRNRYLGHFMNVDGNDKWSMTIARPPQESKFNFQIHNYEATTYELRNAFYIGGDSSKVGIHTTNPQATLDIKGNIRIEDGTQGAGKVLTSDAIGKARWTSPDSVRVSLDSGYILVGDVNNKASAVEMSGDVEIDSDGEATIQDNSVTVAKINSQGNADKVLGTGSGGVPFWGKITVSKMANNAVSTAKIQDDAVTLAKIGTGGLLNANKVLATGNGGNPRWASFDELGDNLGNHRATQNILLQGNWISNNNSRDEKGIKLKDSGSLQLKTTSADVATFERAGIMNFRLISTGDTDHTRNRYLGHFMNVDGNDKWSMTIARPPQESKFNFQIHNYEATTYELRNAFYIGGDSSKVGIHTTNPQATLDIKGNIRIEDGTQGAGKVLTSDAIGKARWTSPDSVRVSLDSGYILVGDVNNKASAVEMSGDVEIDSDGETTIQDNSVTVAKINSQGNADKVLVTESGGVPSWRKITASKMANNAVTTAKMANNAVSTAKIQDDAVTLAKIGTGGLSNANKVLATGNSGNPRWASFDELGDNLGNHRATQNILLQGNWISNNTSSIEKGIKLNSSGSLQLKTTSEDVATFESAGNMKFKLKSTGDSIHSRARNLGHYMNVDGDNKWSMMIARQQNEDKFNFYIRNYGVASSSSNLRNAFYIGGGSSKVGIHTTNPQATLDIKGNIRIEDGTQGAGKVLTSDAEGKGVWKKVGINNIEANGNATNSVLATNANGDLEWTSLDSVGKMANATELDLDSGNILVGDAGGKASSVAMSGDVAISSVGVTTIQDNSVTVAKINSQGNADKVLVTGSGGVPSWRKITASKMANNAVTTAKMATNAVTTAKIQDNAVTPAKIGTGGSSDADKVLATDANGNPGWRSRIHPNLITPILIDESALTFFDGTGTIPTVTTQDEAIQAIAGCTYKRKYPSSTLIIEFDCNYVVSGNGRDDWMSILRVGDNSNAYSEEIMVKTQKWVNKEGGGTRGSAALPIKGVFTQEDSSWINIEAEILRTSGNDGIIEYQNAFFIITEVLDVGMGLAKKPSGDRNTTPNNPGGTPQPGPTITGCTLEDTRDNQTYEIVTIGNQTWMAENLAYLPEVQDNADFERKGNNSEPAYGVYGYNNNDISRAKSKSNYDKYGVLYNWYAVDEGGICPSGWHVPSDDEWRELEDYLIDNGYGYNGSGDAIAKALASTSGWDRSSSSGTIGNDQGSNNRSGFSALPGGIRGYGGGFYHIDGYGSWWTSTEDNITGDPNSPDRGLLRGLWHNNPEIGFNNSGSPGYEMGYGYSVRCVRDVVLPDCDTSTLPGGGGTPQPGPTITGCTLEDTRDNQTYEIVTIGNQTWMAENLAFLPEVQDNADFARKGNNSEPAYGVYGYDGSNLSSAKSKPNYDKYGVLYNWYAVDEGGICPSGWHIPSDGEWTELEDYLIDNGYGYNGSGDDIAKVLASTSGWDRSSRLGTIGKDQASNNRSGFSALPGGARVYGLGNGSGGFGFGSIDFYGSWWTSTEDNITGDPNSPDRGMLRSLWHDYPDLGSLRSDDMRHGFSVRCVRDVALPDCDTSTLPGGGGNTTPGGGGNTSSFRDIRDSKTYKTVTIGNQIWMAENLAYLPRVDDNLNFNRKGGRSAPSYAVYGYDFTDLVSAKREPNYGKYGVLYNWYAVDEDGICPAGWHVPSDAEWTELEDYLANNGYGYNGNGDDIAKALASELGVWDNSTNVGELGNDQGSNNRSGFSALPGGVRSGDLSLNDPSIDFYIEESGRWWSSTERDDDYAFVRILEYRSANLISVARDPIHLKNNGHSVRCVSD